MPTGHYKRTPRGVYHQRTPRGSYRGTRKDLAWLTGPTSDAILTRQVWQLLAEGYSAEGIADKLDLDINQVANKTILIYQILQLRYGRLRNQRVQATLCYLMWQFAFPVSEHEETIC